MLKLSCPKHPKYQAKIAPKASCEPCVALYEIKLKAEMSRLSFGTKHREPVAVPQADGHSE